MKTAVIYARYSSERQTEQSIEGQLRVCNEYAERNDIVIVDTYIDRAMTGTNDKRTDFQRMLKDSNKRAWDYVLVYKIDRFGRNKYELAMNKHTLKNNGIKLISAMENIPDTPEGIILESLLEGMAEYYSAELSQKVKRGMNETRQKGNYTGGYMLYGYKKDGKKVVIDEDKAEIVRLIYERYANNVYVKDIIKELTEKGILNRGKPFAKNTIHRILQNEKYSGVYHYNDEVFTDIYPKIVPDELFKLVQLKNDGNRYGSHSPFVKYLLRKKMICGYCGRTINGITGSSRKKDVKRYYSCSGKYLKKTCCKKAVRKEALEDVVINALLKAFENDDVINLFADKILDAHEKRMSNHSVLNLLLQEKEKIEKSKNNIISAIEQGVITSTTTQRLKELEDKESLVSEQIIIEQSKTKLDTTKNEIVKFIKKALEQNAEILVNLLVKKIVLFDDKVEIYCNYSNNKDKESFDINFYEEKTQLPIPANNNSTAILKDAKVELKI